MFVGPKYGDELVAFVQNSLWLIFPWEEDFGIVPIEVMAAGKPIFALRKWGLTETVLDWKTWAFFDNSEWSDFVSKFQKFHSNNQDGKYKSDDCIQQASQFSEEVFEENLKEYIDKT
jgi:glycosyltransferase involved in cell wall biosynthesis